ncbi:MAG TPA: NADH-quinone oxidoreductase subunit NuoB [Gemmatimonadaceae bacterium]|nr:NADH-quinone oxidoreductase subunit NuoB [Gemmatimonadaceae bacterium]
MFEFLRARLRQGTPAAQVRDEGARFPERFRGLPVLDLHASASGDAQAAAPSALLTIAPNGKAALDLGACLFTPDEATSGPAGTVRFTHDHRMATSTRDALVTGAGEPELAHALDARLQRIFKRSLRLRSVVAGSCGGCEAELVALGNVVFDLTRFGVQFVASPRHADGIVITGIVNHNMRAALEKVYEAMPAPRIVIAVGACAISGGPFRGSGEIAGVPPALPVDLYVPGCPPHPLTLLDGLLRLLDRLPPERMPRLP